MFDATADQLARLSSYIDTSLEDRDPEAIDWARVSKVTEEAGELVAAHIGATGTNFRKGVTHTVEDVIAESLDLAVVALGVVEHFTGNLGHSLLLLDDHLARVLARTRTDQAA